MDSRNLTYLDLLPDFLQYLVMQKVIINFISKAVEVDIKKKTDSTSTGDELQQGFTSSNYG